MTLPRKILIGYGIALSLTAVVLGWAVFNLVRLGQASDAILRENYRSILAAENMIDAIERQDSATLLVMLDYADEGLKQFKENETHFLLWLGRAQDNITIAGEREILEAIEGGYAEYLESFSRLRQMRREPSGEAAAFYHETVLPAFKTVRDQCARLREINQETMFAASERAGTVAGRAIWSTVGVGAAAVIAGLAFSLVLSRLLVRPLRQLIAATEELAEGRYDVRVPAGSSDEVGTLATGFNTMAAKLKAYHNLNMERMVAEQRKSQAILRSIEEPIIVVDLDFKVTNINAAAAHLLGAETDAAEGRHFLELVKNERLFEYLQKTVETGQPPAVEDEKRILSVGEGDQARHYFFSITPVHSQEGGLAGAVLMLRDVTRLKQLDRLKSEFVMTASHELKTPLQSLGMSIDLLQEGAAEKFTEKERQLLETAREELQRLKALISDLLDLSKIEAGKVEMEVERLPVSALAQKAVGVFKEQAEQQQVDLKAEVPDDLPEVRADANKVTWVLTNLISNALRYVGEGGHITISAEPVGEWVHVSVADDGEGIPPEYQSRIFDKFVQVKGEKSVGGTGLGLAICKEIIRAHKGTIWVDSTPGEGSTFTFTLPVASQE
ncbi:MAG: ATP-binding protein [Phycisphaerae bacterium]